MNGYKDKIQCGVISLSERTSSVRTLSVRRNEEGIIDPKPYCSQLSTFDYKYGYM